MKPTKLNSELIDAKELLSIEVMEKELIKVKESLEIYRNEVSRLRNAIHYINNMRPDDTLTKLFDTTDVDVKKLVDWILNTCETAAKSVYPNKNN